MIGIIGIIIKSSDNEHPDILHPTGERIDVSDIKANVHVHSSHIYMKQEKRLFAVEQAAEQFETLELDDVDEERDASDGDTQEAPVGRNPIGELAREQQAERPPPVGQDQDNSRGATTNKQVNEKSDNDTSDKKMRKGRGIIMYVI